MTVVRSQRWIEYIKTRRCLFTMRRASDTEAVDPVHIGTLGKAIKIDDNCVIPLLHHIHVEMHSRGEMTVIRERAPHSIIVRAARLIDVQPEDLLLPGLEYDRLLREGFRQLAMKEFEKWQNGLPAFVAVEI